jgi:hypothetical protein
VYYWYVVLISLKCARLANAILGPIFAKRAIYGIDAWDKVYLALGVIMGVWGTGAAFWPGE